MEVWPDLGDQARLFSGSSVQGRTWGMSNWKKRGEIIHKSQTQESCVVTRKPVWLDCIQLGNMRMGQDQTSYSAQALDFLNKVTLPLEPIRGQQTCDLRDRSLLAKTMQAETRVWKESADLTPWVTTATLHQITWNFHSQSNRVTSPREFRNPMV